MSNTMPREQIGNEQASQGSGRHGLACFWFGPVLACAALLFVVSPSLADDQESGDWLAEPIRGITISCFGYGPGEWDGPHMVGALDEVKQLGANWVTIHPYAQVSRDGRLRWSPRDQDTITHTARLARERGLRVMIKPHLAYWLAGYGWRGDITFPDPADEAQFWRAYEDWMRHHAKLAQQNDVDVLVVGVELKQFHDADHEPHWRRIITTTREHYAGPLTYAANWDDYTQVRFWDALDAIGVQAYFPLVAEENRTPTEKQIEAGWQRVLAELADYQQQLEMPLFLTELGYATSTAAASYPWDPARVGEAEAGHRVKGRALRIGLEAVEGEAGIAGAFLWKWFATPRQLDHEFNLQYPAMKRVISDAWR
ncbi:MAG: hypothetical protein AAGF84_00315 [Planctomycetota bacterium]